MKFFITALLLISIKTGACQSNKIVDEFIATDSIRYSELMSNAMSVMDYKMSQVSDKKTNEEYFLEMMIAHHEGALNMSSALLLNTKSKELTNYAVSIITCQKNEIEYMKTLLKNMKK